MCGGSQGGGGSALTAGANCRCSTTTAVVMLAVSVLAGFTPLCWVFVGRTPFDVIELNLRACQKLCRAIRNTHFCRSL